MPASIYVIYVPKGEESKIYLITLLKLLLKTSKREEGEMNAPGIGRKQRVPNKMNPNRLTHTTYHN